MPSSSKLTPKDYQVQGIDWMYECLWVKNFPGVINADDMGLGKTMQTIGTFMRRRDVYYILIVTPSNVSGSTNWPKEFKDWVPVFDDGSGRFTSLSTFGDTVFRETCYQRISSRQLPIGLDERTVSRNLAQPNPKGYIYLSTYEGLKSESMINALGNFEFDLIVADESHKVKNHASGNSEVFFSLKAKKRIFLSGTVGDKTDHYFPMIRFFYPKYETYAHYSIIFSRGKGYERDDSELIRQALEPFMIRRLKEEVAPFIPPLVTNVSFIKGDAGFMDQMNEMAGDTSLLIKYSQMAEDTATKIKEMADAGVDKESAAWKKMQREAEEVLRLAEKAMGVYTQGMIKGGVMKLRKMIGDEKVSEACNRIIEDWDAESQFVVFYHHKSVGEYVHRFMSEIGLTVSKIDGEVNSKMGLRDSEIQRFTDGRSTVMLASSQAANAGINLQVASRVYVVEMDFSWAIVSQSIARSHRIGQKKMVSATFFVMPDTYDARLWQILTLKRMILEIASGDQ